MLRELPYTKIFLNATVAFISYSFWTYIINDVGAILSSLTQGSMSFVTTFFMASLIEMIHRKSETLMETSLYVGLLMLGIVTFQILMHYVIHTENVLLTVLPSTFFGSLYSIGYIWHLRRGMLKSSKAML